MLGAGMALPAGSLVALTTPMTEAGEVDLAALRRLLRWHKAEGTAGVVVLGTTGEASTLSQTEKEEVMAVTREEIGGVLPIIVGTGAISTTDTIKYTKQAKLFGADAALVRERVCERAGDAARPLRCFCAELFSGTKLQAFALECQDDFKSCPLEYYSKQHFEL